MSTVWSTISQISLLCLQVLVYVEIKDLNHMLDALDKPCPIQVQSMKARTLRDWKDLTNGRYHSTSSGD
ncbi:hypothetical protein ILYODFUR_013994 [Ilyodon furcidens]|uniref:Uncharacterized protein n=1 Tax=Ilyodon furcidens TaxID=33524 RepID=A0ABV0SL32_9TELE